MLAGSTLIDVIVGDWFVAGALKQPASKGKNSNRDIKANILLLFFFFIKNIPPELILLFSLKT